MRANASAAINSAIGEDTGMNADANFEVDIGVYAGENVGMDA